MSARWAIESLILEKNLRKFCFGSGGEFEKLCYNIVKTCEKKYPHITCEVFICRNWKGIKKLIDKSDYCIFQNFTELPTTYMCEGIEIPSMKDRLNFAYDYANKNNKSIFHI